MREEAARQKKEQGNLDVRIVVLEKELERKKVEVRELHSDKQGILQILEHRKGEIGKPQKSRPALLSPPSFRR